MPNIVNDNEILNLSLKNIPFFGASESPFLAHFECCHQAMTLIATDEGI
jgi:hypothetical protein